jgi:hypothetical protein
MNEAFDQSPDSSFPFSEGQLSEDGLYDELVKRYLHLR